MTYTEQCSLETGTSVQQQKQADHLDAAWEEEGAWDADAGGDIKKKMKHIDSLSFYLKHRKAFHEVENTLLRPAF